MDGQVAILQRFADAVKKKYVAALEPVSATRRSIDSIQTEVTPTSVRLLAGYWFRHIDYGRPPGMKDSGGEFHQNLKDWIVKNDSFTLSTKKDLNAATKSLRFLINKEGTRNFGQSRGILDSVDIRREEQILATSLGKDYLTRITNGIMTGAKFEFVKVRVDKR